MDPLESSLNIDEQLHPLDSAYREGERKRIRDELQSSYRNDFKTVDWDDEDSLLSPASMRRARDFVAELVNDNLSNASSHHSRNMDSLDGSNFSTHHSRRLDTMMEAEEYLYNVNLMEDVYGNNSRDKKNRWCSPISGRCINCYYRIRERVAYVFSGCTRRQRILMCTLLFVVLPLIVIFSIAFATGAGSSSSNGGNVVQKDIFMLPISSKPKNMGRHNMVWDTIVQAGVTNGNDLDDEGTPAHVALRWITDYDVISRGWMNDGSYQSKNQQLLLERYALAVFFFSTHQVKIVDEGSAGKFSYMVEETEWNMTANWMSGESACAWFGLSCDAFNETYQKENFTIGYDVWSPVKIADLAGLNIPGIIPSELAALKRLNVIDLSANDLGGTIPVSFGGLTELVALHLPTNYLNGTVPSELGGLSNLLTLNLGENNLEGTVPVEIGELAHLRTLDLHYNLFTGQVFEFTKLHQLRFVLLDDNQFTGKLPEDLDSLIWIEHLSASHNQLDGTIPLSLFNLVHLRILDLSDNSLTGTIPNHFNQLQLLEELVLAENEFTSTLPPSIGQVPSLKVLDVASNKLDQGVPATLGDLHKLEHLVLLNNKFQSQIPPELEKLTFLQTLDLRRNLLFGNFPNALTALRKLRFLGLSHNNITGPLPDLSQFHLLFDLRLENNMFTSTIPDHMEHIVLLQNLDLSNNILSSTIPQTVFQLLFLETLYLGGNYLTGTVPDKFDRLRKLKEIELKHNDFAPSTLPHSIAKLTDLERLELNGNQFTSTIPVLYGELYSLQELDLSENQITGTLSKAFGGLQELRDIHVEHNKMQGTIPPELGNVLGLHAFTFYANNFTGSVPEEVCYLRTDHQLDYIAGDCARINGTIECDCCHHCFPLHVPAKDGE